METKLNLHIRKKFGGIQTENCKKNSKHSLKCNFIGQWMQNRKQREPRILHVCLFTVCCTMCTLCLPALAASLPQSELQEQFLQEGWQNTGGNVYYYSKGTMLTGKQEIEGKTYYFLPQTGEMQVGFQKIGDQMCYFSIQTGEMAEGLCKIEEETYYFEPHSGEMQTGFQKMDGETYYFAPETGKMLTGKQEISGRHYYFEKDGVMYTGWYTAGEKEYYYSLKTGEMLTGRHEIGSSAYYFNEKGVLKTAGWIKADGRTYYSNRNGKLQSGLKKIDQKTYYFSEENNRMLTGWQEIDDKTYYFSSSEENKGMMLKNCIAGTKKEGYCYVDGSGIQIKASEVKKAVAFVISHTDPDTSRDVKLRECYDALWKSCSYQRFYDIPSAKSMPAYANYMFAHKRGNCFRYAASFAYIAKVPGYESRVNTGTISSAGGGMTPHGWTEVKVNGTWYMCDANMHRNHPDISCYMCTDSTYRYRHTRSEAFVLEIRKGKVSWK